MLKITPSKVKNLILNSSLRWGNIDAEKTLEHIFKEILTVKKLNSIKEQNKEYLEKNRLPILLEDPIDKMEFENAIKILNSIPEYTFNKEVLIINISSIFELSRKVYEDENFDISSLKTDVQKISIILKKDIKKIGFNDFRELVGSLKRNIENNTIKDISSFSVFSLLGRLKF